MAEGVEHDEAEVFDFVDEYLRDRASGRVRALEQYMAGYPGHEAAIEREYHALASAESSAPAADAGRVGPYRLLEPLGRGGQGAVWLAEDARIARRVALKVLPPSFSALSRERRERLRREAEVVSRLAHPGICPIYEAEIESDPPYIAMRFVEGETLAQAIARARAGEAQAAPLPLPPKNRAELVAVLQYFERAARALHAAHEAGVVHRDVKPGNLMVAASGEPVVLDFGQARDERDGLAELTLSGEVFGTPAYMSPEQVAAREVDRRTDVWSLGATMYEALTLERAFAGESVPAILRSIGEHAPAKPSSKNRALSADVDVVLATALDKEPARRYAGALELAEDLRRIREYEPILARPAGPLLRLSRWSRRHPALAISISAVILSQSLGLAVALHLLAREGRALDYAVGRHLAERTESLLGEDPSAALALGIEAVELAPNYLTRKALFSALDACHLRSRLDGDGAHRFLAVAFEPRGAGAFGALDDGTLRAFDRESGSERARVVAHEGAARALVVSPRGDWLATGGDDGALRLWRLPDLERIAEHRPPGGGVRSLAIDARGTRIAAATGGSWSWYATEGGAQREGLAFEGEPLARVLLSPDGTRALSAGPGFPAPSASASSEALLWDVEGGRVLRRLSGHASAVNWIGFSPDGARAVTASADGTLRIWSAGEGALDGEPLACGAPVVGAAFAPDGRRIAATLDASEAPRAWIFDLESRERFALDGHEVGPVVHAAFRPDGEELATASFDLTVRTWSARDGKPRSVLRALAQPLEVAWSEDGRRLVTLTNAPWVDVWYGAGRPDLYALEGHAGPVTCAEFAPDGARAVTASRDGTARLWHTPADASEPTSAQPGACIAVLEAGSSALTRAFFAPDGARVCTLSEAGAARLWDGASGAAQGLALEHDAPLVAGEYSRDGSVLLALASDGAAFALDARSAGGHALLARADDVSCARFSGDGKLLVLGGSDGRLRAFACVGGALDERPALQCGVPAGVRIVDLALEPGGARVALACADGRMRVADLGGGPPPQPERALFAPRSIAWSSDRTRLLVIGTRGRGAIRLMDLASPDTFVRAEVFHARDMNWGSFSPDGAFLVTTSDDATAYVRDARDGQPFAHLALHSGPVLQAAFSPGPGPLRVITASADGSARVWPLDPLPPARARKPRALREWEREREKRLAAPLPYD